MKAKRSDCALVFLMIEAVSRVSGCTSNGPWLDAEKSILDSNYSLSLTSPSAEPGAIIQVLWSAPSTHSLRDWIGLYQTGAANTAFKKFVYVGAGASGSVNLVLPADASGQYELRYFVNNSYDQRAVSAALTVASTAGYALTGVPASAAPGATVSVNWAAPASHKTTDWIGLFQVGAANTKFKAFTYVNAGANGAAHIKLPTHVTGNLEFRYFINNTYELKATSTTLAVQQPTTNYALSGIPATATAGATVAVNWSAPATHATTDWIGLYQVGAANTAFRAFVYVAAGANGTATLKLPTDATGQWNLRYFVNGGYDLKATSSVISVAPPQPSHSVPGGSALEFNASAITYSRRLGDYFSRVVIPVYSNGTSYPINVGNNFTIEFWVMPYSGNGSGPCTGGGDTWINGNILIDRDDWSSAGTQGDFGVSLYGQRIAFGTQNNGAARTICGNTQLTLNTWHHVAVTRTTDGQMRIFVDGALDGSTSSPGPTGDLRYVFSGSVDNFYNPYLVIGAEKHDVGPQYPSFTGRIDEVRISNFARYTATFTRPSAPFTADSNTVALYHFNEGSGNNLADASGKSPAGTRLVGGSPSSPTWVQSN